MVLVIHNISQATYERLIGREAANAPQTRLDVADLLEAYENAVMLLQKVAEGGGSGFTPAVADFLYTAAGDPRVTLAEE